MSINCGDIKGYRLNQGSAQAILGASRDAMVYGWRHCHCLWVEAALKKWSLVDALFDCTIGEKNLEKGCDVKALMTSTGSVIEQIFVHQGKALPDRRVARCCKAALTNIVLENMKRKEKNHPLIPIIFCTETDSTFNDPHHFYPTSSETITSRNETYNMLITNSELRRCYKMCFELEEWRDPVLREISEIARASIQCVRLENWDDTCALKKIEAPWENADWKCHWDKRVKTKRWKEPTEFNWVDQIKAVGLYIKGESKKPILESNLALIA